VATLAVGTIGLTAALAPALGSAASGEAPVTVTVVDEAPANFDFGISPTLLPPSDSEATELELAVEENSLALGGGTPPGIKGAKIGLDRSIRLEAGDLPVCRWPAVESGIQIDAAGKSECPRAVVGRAESAVLVAYPENTPIRVSSKGKVYNGGTQGGLVYLLVELPMSAPISSTVRILIPVRPVRRGRIGSEAIFAAPILAAGNGFFLNLQLDLKRGFRQDGERSGYVGAECRDRKLTATLDAVFTDGIEYGQEAVRACSAVQH
jgi:hypothetical protein